MPNLSISTMGVICLLALSSCSHESKSKPDLLDKVQSDTKLINDLKDAYRTFNVYHAITDFNEVISIRLSNLNNPDTSPAESFVSDTLGLTPEVYLKNTADSLISACKKLQGVDISDDSLRSYIGSYISSTIRIARVLIDKGYKSREFIVDYEIYMKLSENYLSSVSKANSLERFTPLTDDQYWKTIEKKNYIRQNEFGEYKAIVDQDLMAGFSILDQLTKTSTNFQESNIYQIELADQFMKKDSLIRSDLSPVESPTPRHIAILKYHAILGRQVYSLYLFEAWLKWRTAKQSGYGFSKYSYIPNAEYEQMREKAALVVLDYVSRHQKDDMAINQFLLFATHEIVTRFVDYPFGNIAEVDFYQLFLNK